MQRIKQLDSSFKEGNVSSLGQRSPSDQTRTKHPILLCQGPEGLSTMAPKDAYKAKPSSKSEMNKPKGGKAKEEKRAALKEKKAAKAGGPGGITLGSNKK
ncbi:hypothetical protein WJX72_006676 [[Myrmecia] bisecta]|uniref:Translation machinery associated TMA7 n=1 Tax=[Myrmecia] bisecta TaxID=41462 RepID=A0AAW1PGW5_9CHLO